MPAQARFYVATVLLGATAACASNVASLGPNPSAPAAHAALPRPSNESGRRAPVAPATTSVSSETVVAVTDPAALHALETAGLSFGEIVLGNAATTTAELARLPALRHVLQALDADVRAAARPYPLAKVTSIDGFRLFDVSWLRSKQMRFALSGVMNRIDRRPFYAGSCGELRFLYRLSYASTQGGVPFASRLPMTLNVVFVLDAKDDAGCRAAARSWQPPSAANGKDLTEWLLRDGALAPTARTRWRLKSVETNLQTFRLQSSVRPSLAGHIEYALRVFHPTDEARTDFEAAPMENMPDVPRLTRNGALRAALLEELSRPEVLSAIDRGTLQLDSRFLATAASSFSPRGLGRLGNRPFSELFGEDAFRALDLSGYENIRSPAALLRRLDSASCVGCHQSKSIAGFHHVGQDDVDVAPFNALFTGSSSHLIADLERRRHYVAALAAGEVPDERRPSPERQGGGAEEGAPCGLGDPGFAAWQCAPGFECTKVEDPVVGTCLKTGMLGAPCEYGTLRVSAVAHRDQVEGVSQHACGSGQACSTNFSGFSEGACTTTCGQRGASCADFLDVDGFQNCLRGRETFAACASRFVEPVGVPSCDAEHPCRQDYVCARTQNPAAGACIPPYFVYQLRLDGYPLKR